MEAKLDNLLKEAIAGRRIVAFNLHSRPRVAKPHDYGVLKGVRQLLFYQVGGKSSSKALTGWRKTPVSNISKLKLRSERFRGSRPAPSGKHIRWERLIATVSSRDG